MAQTYNKLKIDIKEPVTDIITAKQNDSNSRFLDVYLYDGGVPIDLTGHEVRIYMLKADGTEVFNNGEITNAAAGRCQFELTDQALGAYGKLLCEITIWYDNVQILTTQTFDIHVVKNLRTAGSIESSNEYGALVVLYQNLYESIDLMTTMVEQFGEPGEVADAADIATFWQMLEYLYGVNEAALKNASVSEVLERIGLNTDGEDAGTLFGVMNPLDELIDKVMLNIKSLSNQYKSGENVLKNFPSGSAMVVTSSTGSSYTYGLCVLSEQFIPKHDGIVKIHAEVTAQVKNSYSSNYSTNRILGVISDTNFRYSEEGEVISQTKSVSDFSTIVAYDSILEIASTTTLGNSNAGSETMVLDGCLRVYRGVPVVLIGFGNSYGVNNNLSFTRNAFVISGEIEEVA